VWGLSNRVDGGSTNKIGDPGAEEDEMWGQVGDERGRSCLIVLLPKHWQ
jgi:hypothetical protein